MTTTPIGMRTTADRPLFEGVQVLRFVAALLVVFTHSRFYASEHLDASIGVWGGGAAGVDLFFVVSGFVMAVTAAPFEVAGGWRFFAVRRLIRIVPMYWIATTLTVVAILAQPGAAQQAGLTPWSAVASYLFLPTRDPDGQIAPLLGVGWTLTFEAAFYVVFALGLLLRRAVLVFASTVMILVASGQLLRGGGDDWPAWAFYFDQIVLYFVIGMVIGGIVLRPDARRRLLVALGVALAVAVLGAVASDGPAWQHDGLTRKGIIAAVFLAVLLAEPLLRGLRRRPAVHRFLLRPLLYLGDASYSLYLFHPLVGPAVPALLAVLGLRSGAVSVVGSVLLAVTAGALIHRFVEKPITRRLRGMRYAGLPSSPRR
ncbi:acyltransferase family protein [Rathayibacter sp. VKM Ac-2804]|uniref:acyltransferase family protein n=1 Tax=Rathayibacter sp. VKM Ac-2804 TaxID=2609257 RepID=UPI00132EF43C|nr:acyltransferase [Rathayibacter sp. VKM Ac-2804]QHF23622.1 acyltransferase family protein [Rathayibacter sp. VKM Ac-2804]